MEEPEISIPPTSQKRVVDLIVGLGGQAIFTTHSPYVLEEFEPEQMTVVAREHTSGIMTNSQVELPGNLRAKAFRVDIRKRFCEALLARRVLITEGETEASSYAAFGKTAARANPSRFARLDTRGWAIFDAQGETNVAGFSRFFSGLGKQVAAVFDQQTPKRLAEIQAASDLAFEQPYEGFEELVLAEVPPAAQKRYIEALTTAGGWPRHIDKPKDDTDAATAKALRKLLTKGKGDRHAAELLAALEETEFPPTMVEIFEALTAASDHSGTSAPDSSQVDVDLDLANQAAAGDVDDPAARA